MVSQFVLQVMIAGLLLSGTLYILARHEADCSFPKCAMVMAPVVAAALLLPNLLLLHLAALPAVALTLALLWPLAAWLVVGFCWITWPKALLAITVVFLLAGALNAGIALLWH